jgi:hypothetical protein
MPDFRLNRRAAERIVDLFLTGAGAKKKRGRLEFQGEKSMKQKIIIAVVIVLAIVAVLAGVKTWQIHTLIAAGRHSFRRRKRFPPPWRTRKNGRTR